jgi:hypothetical protein
VRRLLLAAALLAPGCASPCLEDLDAACAPLYEPTWENVHARTLEPTCGSGGGSCHAPGTDHGGFVIDDEESTWRRFLGLDGAPPLAEAGDAACSLLVRVVRSDAATEQMPPGDPLSDAEACAIQRWVDEGAVR